MPACATRDDDAEHGLLKAERGAALAVPGHLRRRRERDAVPGQARARRRPRAPGRARRAARRRATRRRLCATAMSTPRTRNGRDARATRSDQRPDAMRAPIPRTFIAASTSAAACVETSAVLVQEEHAIAGDRDLRHDEERRAAGRAASCAGRAAGRRCPSSSGSAARAPRG